MTNKGKFPGLELLGDSNVRKVFVAYLVSYIGIAMGPIAMAFGVLELTGSTKDTSYVIAAPTLASIAILLIGGAIADRTSRQKVIFLAEITAMLAQFAIAYLFLSGQASVLNLALLMLVNGFAMAFNAPASTGLIIQLVKKEQLQSANALLGLSRNMAMIFGAALGGILVATVGAGYTILIDAISFGFSAILIYSLKPNKQEVLKSTSIFTDLKLGWKEFSSKKWIWMIVLQFSFVVAALQAVMGLLGPAVSKTHLNGAADWGLIAGGVGVGTVIGGLIAFRIQPKYPLRLATICVFFLSPLPLALAATLPIYLIVMAALIGGVAVQIFGVIWMTTLQMNVPGHLLSRVSAYDHIGSISLAPLGIVAAGFLYETMGYQLILGAAALLIIIPTLATLLVKEVRLMKNESNGIAQEKHSVLNEFESKNNERSIESPKMPA